MASDQERVFSSGMLSVTTTYRLIVTGDTDLRELDRLIRILTVQKQILEEARADEAAPQTTEAPTGQDEAAEQRQVQGES